MLRKNLRATVIPVLLLSGSLLAEGESRREWHSHAEVARNVMEAFGKIQTYTADFSIETNEGDRKKTVKQQGKCYYKKPDLLRYAFSSPAGNLMVSDGQFLWIYIRELNAVGRQDLNPEKEILSRASGPGLVHLFQKYHYYFDKPEQPRTIDGHAYFVLDLEQGYGTFETCGSNSEGGARRQKPLYPGCGATDPNRRPLH